MVKQLTVIPMHLLIYDTSEAIQYTQAILDFTMLAQYILYNNKTLPYMKHRLYMLKKKQE